MDSDEREALAAGTASRPVRHGKRTQKLLVYLDQNFLSEIAKVGTGAKSRPEFADICEFLRQGVADEKLVVPGSVLHDIESSLATHLKDGIVTHQHRLGLVRLYRPNEIMNRQVSAILGRFLGRSAQDPLHPEIAFHDDPDQRIARYGISVDAHLENRDFRRSRHETATALEDLRQRLLSSGATYDRQLDVERREQRDELLRTASRFYDSADAIKELADFAKSDTFLTVPILKIEAHLFASILTRKPTRQIKPSDTTDISALSAYSPFMDVVCTDAFMADQLRNVAREFGFKVFDAKTVGIRKFRGFLEQFLSTALPIRRPSITAFVLPPKDGRAEAFAFFWQLGASLRAMGTLEYGEIYAFDDGMMPKYELGQMPGHPVPFYGLQDVTPIALPKEATEQEILRICRARCRSDHFVLIDEYKDLPVKFMLGAAMLAEANREATDGYRIFRKIPDCS
jgi:hypothetical protein